MEPTDEKPPVSAACSLHWRKTIEAEEYAQTDVLKGYVIAKTPHRIFEIYADRDEAIQALTPKSGAPVDYGHLATTSYQQLSAAVRGCVLHVEFADKECSDNTAIDGLRGDFLELSQNMAMNGRVLMDFQGVEAFSPEAIELLVEFNKRMRNKGSRVVLCCIEPEVLENFFPTRSNKTG